MIHQVEPLFNYKEVEAIINLFNSNSWLTEFKHTEQFEKELAHFLGVKYCSMVPNGTLALILALEALGVKRGWRVAVPALTMIATANAVRFLGATPVFYDVNLDLCLDIRDYDVDAVIYVSLNGRANNIEEVLLECSKRRIPVIEDACQSFGSMHNGKRLGTLGDMGCFSLSPHKIITTGQGGFIVTNNHNYYEYIERYKDFGRDGDLDLHDSMGINCKFTDLQSVIGLCQLDNIDYRIDKKKHIYNKYRYRLCDKVEFIDNKEEVVPWFVDIYLDNKHEVVDALLKNNIKTRTMYRPLHQQFYRTGQSLPVAERYSERGLFLPSGVTLKNEEIDLICDIIEGVL